jgi:TPP-dependent pyruvate/acetoin dehydrogenase alpha subunit
MLKRGLLEEGDSDKYRALARETARNALKSATVEKKPSIETMFDGVYDEIPDHL